MLKRRVGTFSCGVKGGGCAIWCLMVPSAGMDHVIVKAWKKKCIQIFGWRCEGRLVTMGTGQSRHHVSTLVSKHIEAPTEREVLCNITQLTDYFTVVPPGLANLVNLEILNLFNNQIEELPTSLSSMPKLRILNVG